MNPAIEKFSPSPVSLAGIDFSRVVHDLNREFNPLSRESIMDFRVTGAQNGYVLLSIAIPEGMSKVFVTFFQSMLGFFQFVDSKAKVSASAARAVDPEQIQQREVMRANFQKRAIALFDKFRSEGLPVNMAVRETNLALKAQEHPWANRHTVEEVLRSAGRFRKTERKGGEHRKT